MYVCTLNVLSEVASGLRQELIKVMLSKKMEHFLVVGEWGTSLNPV